jgi:hypothetical protein
MQHVLQGTAPQLLDALMAHPLYGVMLIKQLDFGTASTPRSPLEKELHSLMLDLGMDAGKHRWATVRAMKGAYQLIHIPRLTLACSTCWCTGW